MTGWADENGDCRSVRRELGFRGPQVKDDNVGFPRWFSTPVTGGGPPELPEVFSGNRTRGWVRRVTVDKSGPTEINNSKL